MKPHFLLTTLKYFSAALGFIGALSFVRAASLQFDYAVFSIYGNLFRFGGLPSLLWLAACMSLFLFASFNIKKPAENFLLSKIDFMLLAYICSAVFFACFLVLSGMSFFFITRQNAFAVCPVTAYLSALILLDEFIARLRGKTLRQTMSWPVFFKVYPVWKPVGFFSFIFLASQLVLSYVFFFTPAGYAAFFAVCALTFFAGLHINLSKRLETANEEKIRAERFKSELITNVSHDIKTPVTSIINYADLLQKENLQGKAADYAGVLCKKAARLKILIEDLTEASKAGTGNLQTEIHEINFGEIVGQAAGEFDDIFGQKKLALVLRQPDLPVAALADSRHLYRILENLFSNAAKYALEGTRVFAETSCREKKVVFVLQNTSASPLAVTESEAAEQFMRGDRSRQTEGSGLGLYIAKSLAVLMGGALRIKIVGDLFQAELELPEK
ncbi:MAG: HAMP domain-containing histidine kinase [Defluviitaleaceae bacterium]|nr:HAMP domain-containing histidine kinase [Defluviitaleaceae bacterium]